MFSSVLGLLREEEKVIKKSLHTAVCYQITFTCIYTGVVKCVHLCYCSFIFFPSHLSTFRDHLFSGVSIF
jgi:hypothetical protein